jgi:hypothetical protein
MVDGVAGLAEPVVCSPVSVETSILANTLRKWFPSAGPVVTH